MYKCENCGSDSHCGVPLKREMRDGDDKIVEVEVCKQCRCYNCSTKTDWGQICLAQMKNVKIQIALVTLVSVQKKIHAYTVQNSCVIISSYIYLWLFFYN